MCQESFRFLIRIIKKEAHRPWRLVMGIEELPRTRFSVCRAKGLKKKKQFPCGGISYSTASARTKVTRRRDAAVCPLARAFSHSRRSYSTPMAWQRV